MKALSKRDQQMSEGLNNFFSYFESRKDPALDPRVMVGFWVLWNIAGEPPTQEQSKDLAPAIGMYLDRVVTDIAR
jgi:hypothetical protein